MCAGKKLQREENYKGRANRSDITSMKQRLGSLDSVQTLSNLLLLFSSTLQLFFSYNAFSSYTEIGLCKFFILKWLLGVCYFITFLGLAWLVGSRG